MNKKLFVYPMMFATLASLSACANIQIGGTSDSSDSSEDSSSIVTTVKPTTEAINFMCYAPSDQEDARALRSLMEEFTKETGIKVNLQTTPKDNYNSAFKSAISIGRLKPDVAYMDQPLIATYASTNAIIDIEEYAIAEGIDLSAFNQEVLSTNRYKDDLYGLPLNMTAPVLFYNKTMISESDVPNTWEEMLNVSVPSGKALFEGIGNGGYAGWYFQAFIENCGGNLYNPETNKVEFNSPQGVEAAQFLKDLYRGDADYKVRGSSNPFINGQTAFKIGSSYDIDNIAKQKPDLKFGTVLMPSKGGDTHYSCMGGENLVITKVSKDKKASMMLVEFLLREENMKLLAEFTGNFPSIPEYAETNDPNKQVVLEQLNHVKARPVVPAWIEINDMYLGRALDLILTNEKPQDPKTALDTAAAAANQILGK